MHFKYSLLAQTIAFAIPSFLVYLNSTYYDDKKKPLIGNAFWNIENLIIELAIIIIHGCFIYVATIIGGNNEFHKLYLYLIIYFLMLFCVLVQLIFSLIILIVEGIQLLINLCKKGRKAKKKKVRKSILGKKAKKKIKKKKPELRIINFRD